MQIVIVALGAAAAVLLALAALAAAAGNELACLGLGSAGGAAVSAAWTLDAASRPSR